MPPEQLYLKHKKGKYPACKPKKIISGEDIAHVLKRAQEGKINGGRRWGLMRVQKETETANCNYELKSAV